MPSSPRLIVAPEADDDIAAIYQYTVTTWDAQQADTYTDHIYGELAELTRFPGIGLARTEIAPGLRSRLIGEHVAYCVATDDAVVVLRVLHSLQDASNAFGR